MATYDFDQELDAPKPLTVFPEGLCSFSVVKMEKKREDIKNKGVSVGICNVARIYLAVTHVTSGETDTLDYDLVLESSRMFRVWEFFTAIGQRKHGDTQTKFAPNWAKVVGTTGLLLTKHAQGKKAKDDGTFPVFVNIAKFLTEEDAGKLSQDVIDGVAAEDEPKKPYAFN
jgi:hypothetical protein